METTLGIIAACIPTLNPILKKLFRRLGLWNSSSNSHQRRSHSLEPMTGTLTPGSVNSTTAAHFRRRSSYPGVGNRLRTHLAAYNMLDLEDIYLPRPSKFSHGHHDDGYDSLDEYFHTYARMRMDGTRGSSSHRRSDSSHRSAPPRLDFVHAPTFTRPSPLPKPATKLLNASPHGAGGTDARDFGANARDGNVTMHPRSAGAPPPPPPPPLSPSSHSTRATVPSLPEEPRSEGETISDKVETAEDVLYGHRGLEDVEENVVEECQPPRRPYPVSLTLATATVVSLDSKFDTDMDLERGRRRDESIGGILLASSIFTGSQPSFTSDHDEEEGTVPRNTKL